MYNKILVPLDGSRLAECAFPHVEVLAKGCDATDAILVGVTERIQGYRVVEGDGQPLPGPTGGWLQPSQPLGQRLVPEVFGKKEKHLDRIAKTLTAKGVNVNTEVPLWKPAEAIVEYARETECDLIVMATHGRSGPSQWAYGSVADKVLRSSCVPVLLVRAPGCVLGV
jgi:nucleotide-binding universal stress UspA family protein